MTFAPSRRHAFSLLGLVAIILLSPACRKAEPIAETPGIATSAAAAARETAAPATASMGKVEGTWLRTDGGYRLVIGTIGSGGHTTANYFNPNPIKVAWTRVRSEGGEIKVDLELRDENYPGCLYKLTYDAAKDVLVGTYFQAQLQETYQVEFARQSQRLLRQSREEMRASAAENVATTNPGIDRTAGWR